MAASNYWCRGCYRSVAGCKCEQLRAYEEKQKAAKEPRSK